jgi:CheY-like chemotaxis protein
VNAPRRPLVLLVEDSEPVRDAYTILLEESGYRVNAVGDGMAAMRSVAGDPPDLVLLDLGLPGMDGLQLIRTLKSAPETSHAPIFVITGRDEPAIRLACTAAGCAEFLVKPVPTQQLLRTLAEHLPAD